MSAGRVTGMEGDPGIGEREKVGLGSGGTRDLTVVDRVTRVDGADAEVALRRFLVAEVEEEAWAPLRTSGEGEFIDGFAGGAGEVIWGAEEEEGTDDRSDDVRMRSRSSSGAVEEEGSEDMARESEGEGRCWEGGGLKKERGLVVRGWNEAG